ncbi:MAG: RsmE family RNA methyltransferase [Actinobacteria bacterium]|nr:RsmE family RNA methyltransferase [Actinomycetota bacterium]
MIPFLSPRSPATIGIAVGPEGGFAAEEVHVSETPGCQSASMGDLILRTETAGSYAVMLVRYHYGRLNQGGA